MSLRVKRRLLRLFAMTLVAGAVAIFLIDPLGADGSSGPLADHRRKPLPDNVQTATGAETRIDFEQVWHKPLQRVLFDPPPPPPKVVEIPPPPPLNVKLVGTMINRVNSQAIIQDQSQNVHFRSLGEPVTPAHPDAIIEEILPNCIKVRREDNVTTLNIE